MLRLDGRDLPARHNPDDFRKSTTGYWVFCLSLVVVKGTESRCFRNSVLLKGTHTLADSLSFGRNNAVCLVSRNICSQRGLRVCWKSLVIRRFLITEGTSTPFLVASRPSAVSGLCFARAGLGGERFGPEAREGRELGAARPGPRGHRPGLEYSPSCVLTQDTLKALEEMVRWSPVNPGQITI